MWLSRRNLTVFLLFILVWLSPVLLSLSVAGVGFYFSFVGQAFQSRNLLYITFLVGLAALAALCGAVAVRYFISRGRLGNSNDTYRNFSYIELAVLVFIFFVSAYGLFRSFGGFFFISAYVGPQNVWLGYGAWSVTFLLSFSLLFFEYMRGRRVSVFVVMFVSLVFLPFLLSGSRIDFLSFMLAFAIYVAFREGLNYRLFWVFFILCWSILVVFPIRYLRSLSFVEERLVGHLADGGVRQLYSINLTSASEQMVYLSTIGDIGASVFQVVGLIGEGEPYIGIFSALRVYAERLLPGPIFPNRPGNLVGGLEQNIGGGALHAVGEGVLVAGPIGVILVGLFMGALIAGSLSVLSSDGRFRSSIHVVMFLFPWLILLRGGWYQFFAFFKSIEIFGLLIFLLFCLRFSVGRYRDG